MPTYKILKLAVELKELKESLLKEFGPPFLPEGFVRAIYDDKNKNILHISIGDRDMTFEEGYGVSGAGTSVGTGRKWDIKKIGTMNLEDNDWEKINDKFEKELIDVPVSIAVFRKDNLISIENRYVDTILKLLKDCGVVGWKTKQKKDYTQIYSLEKNNPSYKEEHKASLLTYKDLEYFGGVKRASIKVPLDIRKSYTKEELEAMGYTKYGWRGIGKDICNWRKDSGNLEDKTFKILESYIMRLQDGKYEIVPAYNEHLFEYVADTNKKIKFKDLPNGAYFIWIGNEGATNVKFNDEYYQDIKRGGTYYDGYNRDEEECYLCRQEYPKS